MTHSADNDQLTAKPKRRRSPSYPGVDLETALGLAEKIYGRLQDHQMPMSSIATAMGYSPKSSGGMIAAAALKHFGLLDDSGKGAGRKAALTELALKIIRDKRQDQSERKARIKKVALMPAIHAEICSRFGPSPALDVLEYFLESEKSFTSTGVADLISKYGATMAFAEISEGDSFIEDEGDTDSQGGDDAHKAHYEPPPPSKERAMPDLQQQSRDLTLLLTGGRMAILRAPVEISDADYNLITGQLTAMKAAFVTMATKSTSQPEQDTDEPTGED